jgi:putative MFS transporter
VLTRQDASVAAELIARVDRLPVWPHSRWVLSILALGWFFCYFDIQTIAFSLPNALKFYGASTTIGATTASLGLVGFVVGQLGIGILSERKGRRAAIFSSISMYAIGALLNSIAPDIISFIGARFISGCGIGAFIGVASTYVSEVMPAPIRGKFAAWITLPAFVGGSGAMFVALALVPNFTDGWRILLALPVIGLVPLILGAHALPESIRWLIEHDRLDAAGQIVTLMETRAKRKLGSAELPPVQASVRAAVETEERENFTWTSIFRPPVLRYTLVFFFVWFWNYVAVYGFGTMGVTLLVQNGYSLVHSIQMAIAGAVGFIVGGLISPFISDRFSRKWPPFIVTILLGIELLLLGAFPGPVLITLYYFSAAFQVGIFAPLIYLLTAEHFPTSGRNIGMAFSNGVAHIGGAIGPFLATYVAASFGFGAMFLALSACFWLCALCLLFAKQTTKRNLEAIIVSEYES